MAENRKKKDEVMKCFALLIIIFSINTICFSQDYIYLKDKSIQKGKILEVGIDKIKYKKFEILNGPIYELPKTDVLKIRYSNGFVDHFEVVTLVDSISKEITKNWIDTTQFSKIYFLFNDGQDQSQKFPIYLNGKYLFTIKNHMRITYKIFSTGLLTIERNYKKKIGPKTDFMVEHGREYGVRILEPYPQGLDPNKRFSIQCVIDKQNFDQFFTTEFKGFKPFKEDDIYLIEDIKDPVIE